MQNVIHLLLLFYLDMTSNSLPSSVEETHFKVTQPVVMEQQKIHITCKNRFYLKNLLEKTVVIDTI